MDELITTVYKGAAVVQAIKQFSPQKVFFLVDDPLDDIRKSTIKMIKDLYPQIEYDMLPAKIYDIVDISKKVIELIKKEKDNNITIHISEGRKTMSLGLLFGAYVMRNYVGAAYYITEETNTPIKLPLIELSVSKQKTRVLKLISEGIIKNEILKEKLNLNSISTVYVHIKELRDEGYLNKDNRITEIGRIILLNNVS